MFHSRRIWCVTPAEKAEVLAADLTRRSWTLCTAFELAGYLFLNDSTSEDGASEWAVVRIPCGPGESLVQVESITFGWCSYEAGLKYIRRAIAGEFDNNDFATPVTPRLQSREEHGRCPRCA